MTWAATCRTLALAVGLSGAAAAHAAGSILVGMTLPLSGPEAAFGMALRSCQGK
jgi:hypothetical protein